MEKIKENKTYIILGVMVCILLNYLFYYFRVTFEGNALAAIDYLFSEPQYLLYAFPLSFNVIDLFVPLFTVVFAVFVLIDKKNNKKKYKKGVEHGSAQWGDVEKDLKGMYDEEDQYNNILFSQNTKIKLDDKGAPFKLRRNKNVYVVGGSGSGKTRFVIKPNMLQMNASYVCTDPKGTIVNEVGMALKNIGKYKIKIFNTVKFSKSMRYNPLQYVYNEQDILKLVHTIIANTSGDGPKGDPFWEKAESLLYQAYFSLIVSKFPKEEQHLGTLMDLITYSTVKEDDEDYKNPMDYLFEELEKEDSNHFAVKQYKLYKLAAGKTAKSILISCGGRLSPLNIPAMRDLLSTDELELDTLGDEGRKTAMFIIVPDTDDTFNFIVAIMYSQLFNMLCTIADDKYKGEFPTHVRFLLDEFANIGQIPNFEKLISTIRSRNTRSNNNSFGQAYSKLGRSLMTQDELLVMERDECIVQIIGKRPFKDKKYDLTKHPRYKFHSEGKGKKYWFDIEKYLEALKTPKNQQKRNSTNKQEKQREELKLILTTVNGSREIT